MRWSLKFLTLTALVLVCGNLQAAPCGSATDYDPLTGQINVGPSGRNFTVFGLSGFYAPGYTNNTFTGPSYVKGNIGVGPGGTFSMSDGRIDGDIYMYGSSGFTRSGPAVVNGTVLYNQGTPGTGILDLANTDYQSLASAAASDPGCGDPYTVNGSPTTLTNVNITNVSQSMTLRETLGQKVVINLQNFVMTAGTFTLEGTATTTYIINVSKQFSLNNSKIVLADLAGVVGAADGVQAANVLFNIRSKGIQISLNQGTQMSGILLAPGDKISLSGGKVFGRVIGAQVNITSGGQVISQ